MTESERVRKLEAPKRPVHAVIDSDTACEVDDQFAVAYAIRSMERGEIVIEAFYAAPFPELRDGVVVTEPCMKRSCEEILKIKALTHTALDIPVFEGAPRFMDDGAPIDSPAVRDLIARAMRHSQEDPLYVITIGDTVNTASAILLCPEIVERIVICSLAGNEFHFPLTDEYNVKHDRPAFNAILSSGVPLVMFPCRGVVSHLITSQYEIEARLAGKSELCDYLCNIMAEFGKSRMPSQDWARSHVIWDVAPVAWLIHPEWYQTALTTAPMLSEDFRWIRCRTNHQVRVTVYLERDPIFGDLFEKLTAEAGADGAAKSSSETASPEAPTASRCKKGGL